MKHYFLGAAANCKHVWRHLFAHGSEKDAANLASYLSEKYHGETILTKNGRSALSLALRMYFEPGDKVMVNGFTCYAVVEALEAAGIVPVYTDISAKDLNYDVTTLKKAYDRSVNAGSEIQKAAEGAGDDSGIYPKGIIIQNSLGNPVDIVAIEKFVTERKMLIIEDLAHSVGVKYPDGREAGTVGAAAVFSFGKEKSIDTISGGAVVLRDAVYKVKGARTILPQNKARTSDNLRARFYPLFGKIYRGLSYVRLNGVFMRILLALHWVEKSADNRLDLTRKIGNFEAKLALKQFRELDKKDNGPLRTFYLLDNRADVLSLLKKSGYFFDGFWYERPVSPERYYKKVRFPEAECPVAVAISQKIINFPNYYSKSDLAKAERIVREQGKVWEGAK
ncbi:DegT/DnrJ/EryC1/StrS aminotransferase family protein [Candidatus Saccharibacteria bacterium]|nr:DegT/DnrJ/EryC1/StrS aminotransferase family protein [Candidatus Saccharibacteria bacterium]